MVPQADGPSQEGAKLWGKGLWDTQSAPHRLSRSRRCSLYRWVLAQGLTRGASEVRPIRDCLPSSRRRPALTALHCPASSPQKHSIFVLAPLGRSRLLSQPHSIFDDRGEVKSPLRDIVRTGVWLGSACGGVHTLHARCCLCKACAMNEAINDPLLIALVRLVQLLVRRSLRLACICWFLGALVEVHWCIVCLSVCSSVSDRLAVMARA